MKRCNLDSGHQATILVVDDEMGARLSVKFVLRAVECTVIEAIHGYDALELWEQHAGKIDLLFTDMMMPGMDGLALAEQLRSKRPDLKVIIFSGHPKECWGDAANGLKDFVFLDKACTPELLRRTVRVCLKAGDGNGVAP